MTPWQTVTSIRAAHGGLRRVLAELTEVAAWASPDGCFQEHASFLLGTRAGAWLMLGFAEPEASELVAHLMALPGFDTDRLSEIVMSRVGGIEALWSASRCPVAALDMPAQRSQSPDLVTPALV